MPDPFTVTERSRIMSLIRGKDTKPEKVVRSVAHRLGYRFRLHRRDLPGTPDLVFPRLRKLIFVHGCFWHRHTCLRGRSEPASNTAFWRAKLEGNAARDARTLAKLRRMGWRVMTVWECELKHPERFAVRMARFLTGEPR